MLYRSLQYMFLCLALLISTSAQAGLKQFTESYTGYFNKQIDPDSGLFQTHYGFDNGTVSLSTDHYILEDYPFYLGFGTFSRVDSVGVLSGNFDLASEIPDYDAPGPSTLLPITGTFISGFYLGFPNPGNTGPYRFGAATGFLKGFIDTERNYTSFNIDWTVVTPDPISPVPEPETFALLLAGLGLVGFSARRKQP